MEHYFTGCANFFTLFRPFPSRGVPFLGPAFFTVGAEPYETAKTQAFDPALYLRIGGESQIYSRLVFRVQPVS